MKRTYWRPETDRSGWIRRSAEKSPGGTNSHTSRRLPLLQVALQLCALLVLAIAALPVRGSEPQGTLIIVTSFPPSMFEPFCAAFEKRHPGVSTLVRSKKTSAALTFIAERPEEPADLIWASAPDAFELLRESGHLEQAFPALGDAAPRLDDFPLDDPHGYYRGFALSGYGLMWNIPYLNSLGLPPPNGWHELTLPQYAGHVAITAPSRSGTMHLIVETILQRHGWDEGWATLLRLAGNLATITARSFGVSDGVIAGRFGVGATIDFFGLAAKRTGAAVDFHYPQGTVFLPASIGVIKRSTNRKAALAFVDFVLSESGQHLLCRPEISRLPISPTTYTTAPADYPNPYTMTREWPPSAFDVEVSGHRYHLVNTLFDTMITYRQQALRRIWASVYRADTALRQHNRPDLRRQFDRAIRLLLHMPVSDAESRLEELAGIFERRSPGMAPSSPQTILEREWENFASANMEQAQTLITEILAVLEGSGK